VLALLGACVAGALLLVLTGHDPIEVYRLIVERGVLDDDGLTGTLQRMAPLLLIGAGLLVCLRAGLWNIGIDGQVVIGALACGVVAGELVGSASRPVLLIVGLFVGAVGGAIWGLAPAILKVRFGLNEIIVTVMFNYLAFNVASWLVKGPFRDTEIVTPQTVLIPLEFRLPSIPNTEVHIGLVIALFAVVLVWFLFRSTVAGAMLDVLGRNDRAARHAGFPVTSLTLGAFAISGGAAGLAGAIDITGIHGVFKSTYQPGYGFTVFALVYLARLRALALIPFALLLSALAIGGDSMSRRADVPNEFVHVLEGLMLLFFALSVWWNGRRAA
jgi:simple sugar transport system permease protein